jgi:hypothetical protein
MNRSQVNSFRATLGLMALPVDPETEARKAAKRRRLENNRAERAAANRQMKSIRQKGR